MIWTGFDGWRASGVPIQPREGERNQNDVGGVSVCHVNVFRLAGLVRSVLSGLWGRHRCSCLIVPMIERNVDVWHCM